jgi:hypothetical protein
MGIELLTQERLRHLLRSPPGPGVLLFLTDVSEYPSSIGVVIGARKVAVAAAPAAPFGLATDADRDRLAIALGPLNVALSRSRERHEAWVSFLVHLRPAGVFVPEAAIPQLVAAGPGILPVVWEPLSAR